MSKNQGNQNPSIVPFIGPAISIYNELLKIGVFAHTSATLDYHDATLQPEWHIQTPVFKSRVGIIKDFLDRILAKDIKIKFVLEAHGHTIPDLKKDLYELGIIELDDDKLTIKVDQIVQINTDTIIVIYKISMPYEYLVNDLIRIKRPKNPLLTSTSQTNAPFAVSMSNPWSAKYQEFRVVNIQLTFKLRLSSSIYELFLSNPLKDKLLKSKTALIAPDKSALSHQNFLIQVKDMLERYKSYNEKLIETFKVDPANDVQIIDISPEIETFKFISDDIEVLLPTAFNITINFDLGSEMEFKGIFQVDNRLVAETMWNIINGIEVDNKNENKQKVFDLFKDLAQG